jgi:uncharacterized DUF497 family protein
MDSAIGVHRAVRFEWDDDKNAVNQTRHGISFEEATERFDEEVDSLEIFDELHSDAEDRFISIPPRGGIINLSVERGEAQGEAHRKDIARESPSSHLTSIHAAGANCLMTP